ncbi:hypothetical protein [Algoriphagus sp.]|uniref:hypothetical protein n=1 Tax=Algoriphagus sp. TaxID=1872435 RepID=UPI0025E9A182|nr:hypothetical protein [Algoriphagus sp.]
MLNQSIFFAIHPDAPKNMRVFGDKVYDPTKKKSNTRGSTTNSVGFESRDNQPTPGLQIPELISSYKGGIDTILFAFPNAPHFETNETAEAYKSLIKALRIGTNFIVVHYEADREVIENWFTTLGHRISSINWVPLPSYVDFTDWAEDAYVALKDAYDETYYLMEPWEFPRSGDQIIADTVDEYTFLNSRQAPLIFQGGNCLVADDFWILGKDYYQDTINMINDNTLPLRPSQGQTIEDLVRKSFSDFVDQRRPMFVAGTKKEITLPAYVGTKESGEFILDIVGAGTGPYQPIFHIDMFISLIGKNKDGLFEMMVGSPKLGNKLLGLPDRAHNLQEAYDEIARSFKKQGIKVYRNPLVHFPEFTGREISINYLRELAISNPTDRDILSVVKDFNNLGARDNDVALVRNWHHITSNNCLVENSEVYGKHVYLPTFGHGEYLSLSALDDQMKKLWEKYGFNVHQLGDFNSFAKRQGVVHCISKYIKRTD